MEMECWMEVQQQVAGWLWLTCSPTPTTASGSEAVTRRAVSIACKSMSLRHQQVTAIPEQQLSKQSSPKQMFSRGAEDISANCCCGSPILIFTYIQDQEKSKWNQRECFLMGQAVRTCCYKEISTCQVHNGKKHGISVFHSQSKEPLNFLPSDLFHWVLCAVILTVLLRWFHIFAHYANKLNRKVIIVGKNKQKYFIDKARID